MHIFFQKLTYILFHNLIKIVSFILIYLNHNKFNYKAMTRGWNEDEENINLYFLVDLISLGVHL